MSYPARAEGLVNRISINISKFYAFQYFATFTHYLLISNQKIFISFISFPYSVFKKKFWLVRFYGTSTFVRCWTPNPFLYKQSVLFRTIQFNISTQFDYQKKFLFQVIQFIQTVLIQPIPFSIRIHFVYTQLNVKTVLYETNQFSPSTVSKLKTV